MIAYKVFSRPLTHGVPEQDALCGTNFGTLSHHGTLVPYLRWGLALLHGREAYFPAANLTLTRDIHLMAFSLSNAKDLKPKFVYIVMRYKLQQ